MKSNDFLSEGFVEDANDVHADHEVQMARADLFHAAENALALHKLLRHVSEQSGLEGWVAAKITLAADYLNTVREHMEYQLMNGQGPELGGVQQVLPIAEGRPEDLPGIDYPRPGDTPRKRSSGERNPYPYSKEEDDAYFNDIFRKKREAAKKAAQDKQEGVAEGLKDIKRAAQGWGGAQDKPADIVKRNKGYDTDTAKKVRAHLDNAPDHTPAGLQKRVLDRKLKGVAEGAGSSKYKSVKETSAGSVAGVVNPTPKNKAKVGTLFGGTYKQKKAK